MDPFSLLLQTLSKAFSYETITQFLLSGYWVFFLLFYGGPHWGKDKLDWPERLLLSLPLGFFISTASIFPTLFILTLTTSLKTNIHVDIIWGICVVSLLLILTFYRYYANIYISSKESINKLYQLPIKKIIIFCYFSIIPILVFSLTVGSTNAYLSNQSKNTWRIVFPFLYFFSILFMHIYYYITLEFIPLIIDRKALKNRIRSLNLLISIDDILKIRNIDHIIQKAKYFIIIISIVLLLTSMDPVFHIFTPQLCLFEEKRNPDFHNVVIKPMHEDESYLIPLTMNYFYILPKIPLLMLSIKNPSNFSDSIGDNFGYTVATVENYDNIELIINKENDDVVVDPIWTNDVNGYVKINYYNKVITETIINFVNKSTIKEDFEYEYYFIVNKTDEEMLKIDRYYLIPPKDFRLYKITSYINERNVTDEITLLNDWLYIRSMYIYDVGESILMINMKRKEN